MRQDFYLCMVERDGWKEFVDSEKEQVHWQERKKRGRGLSDYSGTTRPSMELPSLHPPAINELPEGLALGWVVQIQARQTSEFDTLDSPHIFC